MRGKLISIPVNSGRRVPRGVFCILIGLFCCLIPAGCGKQAPVTIGSGTDSINQGMVLHTGNILVARYVLRPHSAAQVMIEFGPTPAYGLRTWTVSASPDHAADILVAGMRGGMVYHMRALVRFPDGTVVRDTDHAFRTDKYPRKLMPRIQAQQFGTPQPGVELIDRTIVTYQAVVTDLEGHVIWAYRYPDFQSIRMVLFHHYEYAAELQFHEWMQWVRQLFGAKLAEKPMLWDPALWRREAPNDLFSIMINPIKLLPNGNFIAVIGPVSSALIDSPNGAPPPHTTIALREFNLADETIQNLTMRELNRRLAAIGYKGPTIEMVHHEVTLLPDGHFIVVGNGTRDYTNLPGYPGRMRVIGDVLIELDQNFNPVWTWSDFDHLDVNHHPLGLPDWTHTNAVLYSKDDGDLLVSMRAQHWVIKIDFQNGRGTGKVLWRLGAGGDFRLIGGRAPDDWTYGQHGPAFFGQPEAGVFDLGIMDNGFGRRMPDGKDCGMTGGSGCYSSAVIYRIDEKARTATIVFRRMFPPAQYSWWGGNVQSLPNGDIGVDLCSVGASNSDIYDLTRSADPQVIWHMHLTDSTAYRAYRLGSLYPGVQW